jgi:hypothetical protein
MRIFRLDAEQWLCRPLTNPFTELQAGLQAFPIRV